MTETQLPLPIPEAAAGADGSLALPRARRIFCNRSLRLDRVQMVGFDMDYTLAIYNQPEMDRLSIEATVKKLVDRGYPERLLGMHFRTDFPLRGLFIDKKAGNVLKMDRYRYVKRAYHGMRELTREERRELYHTKRIKVASKRYHWVDTLYALSEVAVFCAAVEELEKNGGAAVDYDKLFTDVRACIDLAHQDGSILDHVLADLPRYVVRDPALAPTLHKLRSSGKRLFLLTNSRAEYTQKMMTYLVGDAMPEYPSWQNYFDVIVTASAKPRFFTEQAAFQEVLPGGETRNATAFERGKVYMGGNILEFEALAGFGGDAILYVGDHIYGDVLRAKKETAWRTTMIIQEMEDELGAFERCADGLDRMDALDQIRDELQDELRDRQSRLKEVQRQIDDREVTGPAAEVEATRVRHRRAIDRIRMRLKAIETEYGEIEERVDKTFHPFWGSLFKAGPEVSSFGDQVEQYACLYTSRVSNFLMYSPMHYFRSPRDRMPHEL